MESARCKLLLEDFTVVVVVVNSSALDPGVTADSLNQHYATVSTDVSYERPPPKNTIGLTEACRHTEA